MAKQQYQSNARVQQIFEDLEKYHKLGVQEVWFWISDRLEIYTLVNDSYQQQNSSYNLTNLDSKLLEKYTIKNVSQD